MPTCSFQRFTYDVHTRDSTLTHSTHHLVCRLVPCSIPDHDAVQPQLVVGWLMSEVCTHHSGLTSHYSVARLQAWNIIPACLPTIVPCQSLGALQPREVLAVLVGTNREAAGHEAPLLLQVPCVGNARSPRLVCRTDDRTQERRLTTWKVSPRTNSEVALLLRAININDHGHHQLCMRDCCSVHLHAVHLWASI